MMDSVPTKVKHKKKEAGKLKVQSLIAEVDVVEDEDVVGVTNHPGVDDTEVTHHVNLGGPKDEKLSLKKINLG